jgi:hypothetical protein
MSWSGLASNQMVTFTNAQSSPFSLKPGQSSVTSNQCMTKLDITTKYNVTVSGYADNQLVPKSAWVGSSFSILLSNPRLTGPSACIFGQAFPTTVYSAISGPFLGDQLFSDSGLTVGFIGGDFWYEVSGSSVGGYSYQINNSGVIIDVYDCMY